MTTSTPETVERPASLPSAGVIGSDVPIVDKPQIMYLPGRALAFGQAAFRYWPEQPIERHTFVVLCWANAERKQCAKKDAAFALISCGWKMLLPLHPNNRGQACRPEPSNMKQTGESASPAPIGYASYEKEVMP